MNPIIYYDKHCLLCQTLKKWFMKVKRSQVQVEWQHVGEALVCGLNDYSCGQAMKVMTSDGQVHQGFFAVRVLVGYTRFRLLQPLLYIPGVPWIGKKVYSWVAANRYRLGRVE